MGLIPLTTSIIEELNLIEGVKILSSYGMLLLPVQIRLMAKDGVENVMSHLLAANPLYACVPPLHILISNAIALIALYIVYSSYTHTHTHTHTHRVYKEAESLTRLTSLLGGTGETKRSVLHAIARSALQNSDYDTGMYRHMRHHQHSCSAVHARMLAHR